MNINLGLFILLAIAGHFFLTRWGVHTHYKITRQTGYRLLFSSVMAGVLLMLAAAVPASAVFYYFHGRFLPHTNTEIIAVWLFSLFLAWCIPVLRWRLQTGDKISDNVLYAAWSWGTHLSVLLEIAKMASQLVELSVDDDRVFIGFVDESGIASEGEVAWISIVPALSGYRDKNTRELFISGAYPRNAPPAQTRRQQAERHHNILGLRGKKGDMSAFLNRNFRIAVPLAKVETVQVVDLEQCRYCFADDLQIFSETGDVKTPATPG